MLLLVNSDGNKVSLIKQDIRRHKHGVSEQSRIDIFGVFFALILELGHARKFAELR